MYMSDDAPRATRPRRRATRSGIPELSGVGSRSGSRSGLARASGVDAALIPGELAVASDRLDGTHRVAPAGELDLATGDALERELLLAERTDAPVIEVDLAGLTFIDSAGVHVLTRAADRAGSRLRLLPGPPVVQRVFVLAGLDADLPFVWQSDSLGGSPIAVPRNDFYVDWSL